MGVRGKYRKKRRRRRKRWKKRRMQGPSLSLIGLPMIGNRLFVFKER